jgi:2'-5' RNA ligase
MSDTGASMRLFTALWPPPEALDALEQALEPADLASRPEWRAVPRERLHLTLSFHGDDDPARRAAVLDDRLTGLPAPRLRLAGAGAFPGVLWAGVQTDDAAALEALVAGAGADPSGYVAHLTLARRSGRRRGRPALADLPALPPGPWWVPGEVLLVASSRDAQGLRYRPVHRVPLGRPAGRAGGCEDR